MRDAGYEPEHANEPDEGQLTVESLGSGGSGGPRKPSGVARRPLLNALTVVVAVGLVAVLVGVYRSASGGNAFTSPTPTLPPAPTATPPVGWRFVTGPPWAQHIAFSVTQPETGYVCGAQGLTAVTTPARISVGVTHDGGRTWSSSALPGKGQWCDISVDPTNARDVVVMVAPTVAFTQPLALYRSFDAQHWQAESLPADSGGGALAWVQWAWAGSTLFVAPYVVGEQGYTRLAASVDGRPFVRVERGLFGVDAHATSINLLIGLARTLYVAFDCGGCATRPTHLARTHDDGETWTAFAPTYQGQEVFPMAASADGTTLFGSLSYSQTPQYLRSHDEGATWERLPLGPNGMFADAERMLAAPDGTRYAAFTPLGGPAASPEGIYRLLPGSATWVYLAPFPGNAGGPLVLSWNSAGHPAGLWGGAFQLEPDRVVTQGIEYHQP